MLRITDARTGESVDAARARRGLTRVEVHVRGSGADALRVLLVADLLARALEIGGTPVWGVLSGERPQAELLAGAAALGIRPFEDVRDVGSGLGEAQVLHVVAREVGEGGMQDGVDGADGVQDAAAGAVRIAVAPVVAAEPLTPIAPVAPGESAGEGPEPSALRLALLRRPRGEAARIDADALADAHDTLVRWRRAVAAWARQPSRPIPDEARARLRAAWEDDLDVPAVLEVLTWVEASSAFPDGARFETYAYADRLLGLDLTSELGSPA